MTGVILSGGLGTRLQAVLSGTAKVMAPVAGRPFLHFLLQQLVRCGVTRIILCTGYRSDDVHLGIGPSFEGATILYSKEEQPLGTGGALHQAYRTYADGSPWLVMNGDSYLDIDLVEMRREHYLRGLPVTIAAAAVDDPWRYGSLDISGEGCIQAFREKSGAAGSGWVNGGIYIFEPHCLAQLPATIPLSLERDVFPSWIASGIHVFRRRARFIDIGTPESYSLAQSFFADGAGPARKRYALLDRDGTILVEKNYLSLASEVELLPRSSEGLHALRELGWGIIIVTNQSGIARGILTPSILTGIHETLEAKLAEKGVFIDGIYYCPHLPEDGCECRKPKPGLAQRAAADFGFDLRDALVIGDKPCDIELGRNCGASTVLVRTGYGRAYEAEGLQADIVADDLFDAARSIERRMNL